MVQRFRYLPFGLLKVFGSEASAGGVPYGDVDIDASALGFPMVRARSRSVGSQISKIQVSKMAQLCTHSPALLSVSLVAVTFAVTFAAFCLAAPSVALAAGGKSGSGYHPSVWEQLKFPLLNFALYCALIRYLFRKYVAPMLRIRAVQVEQHLNRSAAEVLAVEGELSRIQERVVRFEEEKQEMLREFEQEGVRLAQAARAAAEAEALRVQQDAQNKLKNEWRALEKELRRDLVLSATERAVKRLSGGISAERERALRSGVLRAIS